MWLKLFERLKALFHKKPKLTGINSWRYVLQDADKIAKGKYKVNDQLLVIDWDVPDALVSDLKHRFGFVFAYVSIGEAESYRYYWRCAKAFGITGAGNPDWPENYNVAFWASAWAGFVEGMISRAHAKGFHGVYFDKADAFDEFNDKQLIQRFKLPASAAVRKRELRERMLTFLAQMSRYARSKGLFVIQQNALDIAVDPIGRTLWVQTIDGLAVEDAMYGAEETGKKNAAADVTHSFEVMREVKEAGKPVVAVEYLSDPVDITFARHKYEAAGIPLFIADPDRELLP